ncbi:heavy-metal-associated domain-containing protein [Methanobrevibacter sp.]|uniref:heavy-metal-associated domain-containing protein n=1 Tax=Methanobrevibacter sp. TaxID=66852 RepID=UPI0026DEA9E9|nr:copper chaperone [Methanobrevibacter sp.]
MVMEKLTLNINGEHDDFIVYDIISKIMTLDGVEDAEYDAGIELAKITIDPEKVSKEDIELAAKEEGYSVTFQ